VAITFVQSKQNEGSASITLDATPTAGNLLVLWQFGRGGSPLTNPSGYTNPDGIADLPADQPNRGIMLSYKTSTGSDGTVSGLNVDGGSAVVLAEFSGVDTTPVANGEVAAASNGTYEGGGALSCGGASEVLVVGGEATASFSDSLVTPTNSTVELRDHTISGGEKPSGWAAYKINTSAGSTDKITGTITGSQYHTGQSILFKAGSGGGGGGSGARTTFVIVT
jgi:hypothetical protein